MASTVKADGNGSLDMERWIVQFAIGERQMSVPTNLARIVGASYMPYGSATITLGTVTYNGLALGGTVDGTTTGSAMGFPVSGTGVTISLIGSTTGVLAYSLTLYGQS